LTIKKLHKQKQVSFGLYRSQTHHLVLVWDLHLKLI